MAVRREYARGLEPRDAAADDEHAGIPLLDSRKPRLEPGERLEFGADKRVLHAGDIEFERQPLKADVARDATADRPPHFTEGLETPMRIGDQRTAKRDIVGTAGLQHAFSILRGQHPAGHDDRYGHRILDRPRMRL